MADPPPLPPRSTSSRDTSPSASSRASVETGRPRKDTIHLTPYSASHPPSPRHELPSPRNASSHPYSPWGQIDQRSSSMQSIRPVESAGGTRRTLLLIYIHGFVGDETSFRSFPAHVHNLITLSLAETHVVHTKIYPRYKSRRDISFARDDFSNWLYPHESPRTDVILIGHSLGGILAAEVALLRSHVPNSTDLYQHRILGVAAFDTPFLGMHPSVIGTGIASLFRPTVDIPNPESAPGALSPLSPTGSSVLSPTESVASDPFSTPYNDPNYDPSFGNDIRRPQRSKLENALYFWNKHRGEMTKAASSYVTSHFEFGGCLADFPGLKKRYEAMRALEDVDELSRPRDPSGKMLRRIRFVNYYSASTGRVKIKGATDVTTNTSGPTGTEMGDMKLQPTVTASTERTSSVSPRLSVEEHRDGEVIQKELEDLELDDQPHEYAHISPRPASPSSIVSATPSQKEFAAANEDVSKADLAHDDLPPILPMPSAPPHFDPARFAAKDALKVAQKDHDRQMKAFERAKKDREKSIRDREKMVQKRERAAAKEQAKLEKATKQQQDLQRKEKLKRSQTLNPETYEEQMQREEKREGVSGEEKVRKKQKDRKFCVLPPKNREGLRDATWIRVYMEGMDEVAAHTSLFFVSETYAKLVGDTAERIEKWVSEDATKNALLAEQ